MWDTFLGTATLAQVGEEMVDAMPVLAKKVAPPGIGKAARIFVKQRGEMLRNGLLCGTRNPRDSTGDA